MKPRLRVVVVAVLLASGAGGIRAAGNPTVAVARVTRRDLATELTVQAEFRPYQEVELHAKVSGYLQKINVDFGDRVKAGDLIATIEVPELQDELDQAVAAERRLEADAADAHLQNTRLQGVNRSQPHLIAQEELDLAAVKDEAAAAAVAGAKADVEKYRSLVSYTRITAPFAGVVTDRYVDPGALIQTGSSTAPALVRLSENQVLRLDFPVSVTYADTIAAGDPVEIRLAGTGRTLQAKISRFSRRITMATRTMETEVEVPNPDLKLIPGMYATVLLQVQKRPGALTVPLEAVSGTEHPSVYRVGPDGRLEERSITLGVENPSHDEVRSGLAEGDLVVVGDRSGLRSGEKVEAKLVAADSAL